MVRHETRPAHVGNRTAMPRQTKPLTAAEVAKAKIPAGKSMLKLSDGRGLYLALRATTGEPTRTWRFDFTLDGKRDVVTIGRYPEVTLADARAEADKLRQSVRAGIDPSKARKGAPDVLTFGAVADEWLTAQRAKAARGDLTDDTCDKLAWQVELLRPAIGGLPIGDVRPAHVLDALQALEGRGLVDAARRARATAGRVFSFGMVKDYCISDPAAALVRAGVLAKPVKQNFAAITDPTEFGGLLRAVASYPQRATSLALQLLARTALRQGELRQLRWEWITDEAIEIPAAFMKMRTGHSVPLCRQTRAILDELRAMQPATGSDLVFPSPRDRKRPISEATLNAALARLGYPSTVHVPHGFRSSFSSLANESGLFAPDVIEAALAHTVKGVRGVYNRADHQQERQRLATWWNDECDRLAALPPA